MIFVIEVWVEAFLFFLSGNCATVENVFIVAGAFGRGSTTLNRKLQDTGNMKYTSLCFSPPNRPPASAFARPTDRYSWLGGRRRGPFSRGETTSTVLPCVQYVCWEPSKIVVQNSKIFHSMRLLILCRLKYLRFESLNFPKLEKSNSGLIGGSSYEK
jgi:hypothetical protein